jgi:formyltetrahydrofolate synthetase
MRQDEQSNNRDIVEQLPYLNELMVAIRNINDAILQGKDAREAAENLLSDLPDDWMTEIESKISLERVAYNRVVDLNNRFLTTGYTPTQKQNARLSIQRAGNEYSRNVKKIVVSLLNSKDLLFKTSAKRERNNEVFSVWNGVEND